MKPSPQFAKRLRTLLPLLGTGLLLVYFARSADLAGVQRALRFADLGTFSAWIIASTLLIWLYDSYCLVWLIRTTLGGRGKDGNCGLRDLAPIKAASYILNMVNYHAASLGIAWLVGRRKGLGFLEAAGALAVLSYIDLVAVAAMAVVGFAVAPDVLARDPSLQMPLQVVSGLVLGGAVASVLVIQSGWQLPLLVRLRQVALLRPLAALTPTAMLRGIVLRIGIVLAYALQTYVAMWTFGMTPDWGRMLVIVPVVTVVGAVPVSVSGIGTTQVMMRTLCASFVADGRAPAPVIDALSTSMILAGLSVRAIVALPFLRAVLAELKSQPADT